MSQPMPSDTIIHRVRQMLASPPAPFDTSPSYWDQRYRDGGNSGAGSYGRLARFKAGIINGFVAEHDVASVVDFGCGDGAQLALAAYPRYIGLDVSPQAVAACRRRFANDPSKQFYDLKSVRGHAIKGELSLSLDVIYHLVEDEIYQAYMHNLVEAATRFVCIYSSNVSLPGHVPHIRHRCFTDWFATEVPEWALMGTIRNPYPHDPANPGGTSWADFYFFARTGT